MTEELTRMKKLDEVGGINYIAELTNDAMSSFNVEEHARIVAENQPCVASLTRVIASSVKATMGQNSAGHFNDAESSILNVTGAVKRKLRLSALVT